MPANAWLLIKETVTSFIEDEALSRGAAISFYTVTSIAPVLYITSWLPSPGWPLARTLPGERSPTRSAV